MGGIYAQYVGMKMQAKTTLTLVILMLGQIRAFTSIRRELTLSDMVSVAPKEKICLKRKSRSKTIQVVAFLKSTQIKKLFSRKIQIGPPL